MARKSRPAKKSAPARAKRKVLAGRKPAARKKPDPLDTFIAAAVKSFGLPLEKAWLPAVRNNLRVTLQHAAAVDEFTLPDDAQPAPVFRA